LFLFIHIFLLIIFL